MKVIAYDPFLTEDKAKDLNIEKVELDNLLQRADFITLHTPLNDSTRGILDKDSLAKAKKGVRIINCARGGLINEADLKEAIESGQVAGAALDVFEEEPAKENVLFGMEDIVATPHLGASTTEAQENVAIQVAEQISDYLANGTVTNALNIPSISAEEASKLEPYTKLAEQLGSFTGQLTETSIKSINIEYEGSAAALNTKPITAVVIMGVLSPLTEGVNMVNAPIIAKERKIEIRETKHDRTTDYQTLIRVTVETETQNRTVCGTIFANNKSRIVEVHGVKLEADLGEHILYIQNEDKPGLIGSLGKLLGDANINVANFHLGRSDQQNEALALVEIDQPISNELIEQVSKLPSVVKAKQLHFPK